MKAFVQNVDKSKIITVSSIMRNAQVVNIDKDGPGTATRLMEKASMDRIVVVDSDRKLLGIVKIDDTVRLQKQKVKSLESICSTRSTRLTLQPQYPSYFPWRSIQKILLP